MLENGPKVLNPKGLTTNYSEVSVGADATAYSDSWELIDLSSFSLFYEVACTGTPNIKLEIEESVDNSNWAAVDNSAAIKASLTDKNLHCTMLQLVTARYFRVKVTELTTTVSDSVLTLRLSVQRRSTY